MIDNVIMFPNDSNVIAFPLERRLQQIEDEKASHDPLFVAQVKAESYTNDIFVWVTHYLENKNVKFSQNLKENLATVRRLIQGSLESEFGGTSDNIKLLSHIKDAMVKLD